MNTPPFIIGAAVMFWGIEVDQLLLAAGIAIAIEISRLIRFRWDLQEAEFKKAAAVCTLVLVGSAVYRYMTGWFNHPAWIMLKWLPVALLPLMLAQVYNTSDRINLRALLWFRRRRPLADKSQPRLIDFSFFYLVCCIFAAGFANNRDGIFYFAMSGLAAWGLWCYRPRRSPLVVWTALILAAAGAGYIGQIGLARLHAVVEQKAINWYLKTGESPYKRFSQIGEIRADKLSNQIVFRVRTGGLDERSLLLRESTYDFFRSKPSIWGASSPHFKRLPKTAKLSSWQLATAEGDSRTCTVAQFFKGNDSLLKLPNGAFQVDNLKADKAEQNDFGVIKVQGNGLKTYHIRYGSGSPMVSEPGAYDLAIPEHESKIIEEIAGELKSESLSPPEIIEIVKNYFRTHFTYSLRQKSKLKNKSPITNFLSNTRSGHCEFFATATVLLLRQAGVPARYARGYSVVPDGTMDGWSLVRARYAHAWTVVYLNGAWQDLDTTPGNWLEMERQQESHWEQYRQKVKDVISSLMFRFTRWRQQMQSKGYLNYLPLFLVPFLSWPAWRIIVKIIKSRKSTAADVQVLADPIIAGSDSSFYRLEQRLSELGLKRYPWETLSAWLSRIEIKVGSTISLDIPRQTLALHYRYRFDPHGLCASEKSRMTSMISEWLANNEPESMDPKRERHQ